MERWVLSATCAVGSFMDALSHSAESFARRRRRRRHVPAQRLSSYIQMQSAGSNEQWQ